jgi:signal-transduction protein with cAMP-binding, CBS, and nucleotidyltransferase domain
LHFVGKGEIAMTVRTLMDKIKERGFIEVDPINESAYDVAVKMAKAGRDVALVMYKGKCVGIITAIDITLRVVATMLDPRRVSANFIMSFPVQHLTVTEHTLIEEARILMHENQIRHLVVIENGKLVGTLETLDIADHKHNEEIRRAMETGYAMRSAS